jgi:uncharacterized damage-inducible protein DinB
MYSMKLIVLLLLLTSYGWAQQTELPYRQIPDYPVRYSATSVTARMIDGLGFRYYWATDGLRAEDLSYSPNGDARTTLETLIHIYELSTIILNSVEQKPSTSEKTPSLSFADLRQKTLENLKATSDKLMSSKDEDLTTYNMVFIRETGTREFPFWNEINGPIADALWHTGQVVSLRRSSGNPFNSKVNVLIGKLME